MTNGSGVRVLGFGIKSAPSFTPPEPFFVVSVYSVVNPPACTTCMKIFCDKILFFRSMVV